MSCVACDEAQMPELGSPTGLVLAIFVRVGPANVLISGCIEHLEQVLTELAQGRDTKK